MQGGVPCQAKFIEPIDKIRVIDYTLPQQEVERVCRPSLPDRPEHALYEKYFPKADARAVSFAAAGVSPCQDAYMQG